ncbi:hypothetical protein MYMA111404_03735 [Mycoplasma marinum]|uniref:Metallo-beta-lactamase domain-containing protein n=1 Tax=Mycoplasma marinum TaxID=1937190 RepID=A0A4R0XQ24_9MOLU|nr:hypothetical protein [Mycoplasma marinum]TCG10975.1 hypothetical protein C4B24_03370 [Mycoplasma marinum]
METINSKVIPIKFDTEENTLYFDKIKDEYIDTSNFRYLKETEAESFASYKINFNTPSIKTGRAPLDAFIRKIKQKVNKNQIRFGVPIGLDLKEFKIKNYDYKELKEMRLHLDAFNFTSTPPITATKPSKVKLLNVGQGLSVYDENNSFIMDVGGTIKYSNFKSQIKIKKYTVVISHWHYDHYKYLKDMIDDDLVEKIIFPNLMYKSSKIKKFIKYLKSLGIPFKQMDIGEKIIEGAWTIQAPKETSAYKDPNLSSLMTYNDTWMLTGDQSYKRFKIIWMVSSKIIHTCKFHIMGALVRQPHTLIRNDQT